jgi:hypothetical protein
MAERHGNRLRQSQDIDYDAERPARVVLELNPDDHSYRTFLETITNEGEHGFQYGRYFYREEEALANFNQRLRRL